MDNENDAMMMMMIMMMMIMIMGRCGRKKLKSHLLGIQSLQVLPLKPGVGQYIAIHATLTARDFFLAKFYPSGPFVCIFKNLSRVFPVLAVANNGSCVGPQNKIGHPALVTDN